MIRYKTHNAELMGAKPIVEATLSNSDWPPIGADLLEESVSAGPEGPELRPVARIYMKGRYRRASVLPGDGEGLVRQSDAEKWREIAMLRWQMIKDLTRERDGLADKVSALTPTEGD